LHNALSRYFPHALAERIMREGKTYLIPAYKELTILFSDTSSFTKWSSGKRPDQVHGFLSNYLESMAEILFALRLPKSGMLRLKGYGETIEAYVVESKN
jgi:class 3 adenylate cyclase